MAPSALACYCRQRACAAPSAALHAFVYICVCVYVYIYIYGTLSAGALLSAASLRSTFCSLACVRLYMCVYVYIYLWHLERWRVTLGGEFAQHLLQPCLGAAIGGGGLESVVLELAQHLYEDALPRRIAGLDGRSAERSALVLTERDINTLVRYIYICE